MSRITRRQFVGSSLAAVAAGSTMPYLAKASSPNDTIGIALLGVHSRGKDHMRGYLADPRTVIAYVVDVDEKVGNLRCEEIGEKQGHKPTFVRDMREALDSPSVDAISVATPNHWHALAGIWAMQAGKDAYVEKPVCQTIQEGAALIAAARKYKKICQVGTQCRSHSAIQQAMDFLHKGGIGEVKLARGLCYKRRKSIGAKGDYSIPSEVDFDLWTGPAPETSPKVTRQQFHYDWHWQRHYGNGDLGNQGPHQTDIARWGLGVDTHPISVVSYGGRLGYQAERKDENYVDAGDTANTEVSIYDFGDKTLVFETRGLSVDNSADDELNKLFQSTKGNKIGVVFYGSQGYLVQASYTQCYVYDNDMNLVKEFKGGGEHYQNFIDACISRNHDELNADVREGHLSAAISHLGNISYYLGEENRLSTADARMRLASVSSFDDNEATLNRTITHLKDNGVDLEKYPISFGPVLAFDPAKEVFTDSADANAMLTREYRSGFECPTADKV